MKLWPDRGIETMLGPGIAARRAALGQSADQPPRILVRVDEFPCAVSPAQTGFGVEPNHRFHEALTAAGVTYLMAVVPQPAIDHLDVADEASRDLADDEIDLLHRMQADGVVFAQHGLTHRTLHAAPTRHSELNGLAPEDLGALLDEGRAILDKVGIKPRVFVPPFNRFDGRQWATLADRYSVITGGPESVPLVGAQPSPRWIDSAVYLPTYHPLYGTANAILPAIQRVIDLAPGGWVAITLHNAWEINDGLEGLKHFADRVAPFVESWQTFLSAVDRSLVDVQP